MVYFSRRSWPLFQLLYTNKAKLCKDDAKFYMVTISPSQKEVQAMGKTPEEQSAKFKEFIRNDVMQKYAEGFNKNLNKEDIKYYAKIHHVRGQNNDNQMHCHIIVSRKDMDNKIKISPQTNHTGKKDMGTVKSGFHRNEFYSNVERDFDKRFDYNRSKEESFKFCNTMDKGKVQDIEKMAEINATESFNKENSQSQTISSKEVLEDKMNQSKENQKSKGLGL